MWSIIGFLHYEFNVASRLSAAAFLGRGQHPTKPIVFFLSAEKAMNRGYADVPCSCWCATAGTEFTQSAETRRRAVSLLLGNPDYVDVLFRIAGLSARRQVFVGRRPCARPKAGASSLQVPSNAVTALGELISLRHTHYCAPRRHRRRRPARRPRPADGITAPSTPHGRAVAWCPLMASAWADQPAWQFARAMAVAEPLRGTGVAARC